MKIRWTRVFKADYKRLKRSGRFPDLDLRLSNTALCLQQGLPLPANQVDHALTGNWISYRECHVYPDLLLVYRREAEETIVFGRLGSHGELFR